ncbi:MAG: T9SS type A sorting domain-containing protein [Candidatus Zixiibacteriota bacterium]|nr:MAG: T9SS type A sorting domain-containing protein [candidate division Zixibacteria bacterium]
MKKRSKISVFASIIALLAMIAISSPSASAQNLLNNPESVVYDSLHDRYLVSNFGDGSIVAIASDGTQSYFDTTLTRIAGILNKRDTLFVASNDSPYIGLVAYSLQTDDMLFFLPIPSVGLLNDLDYDNQGYIYISDYWDDKLWRVDMNAMSCTLFVDPLQAPNGVICDTLNNRLLVISVVPGTRPIVAVDFTNGSTSVVVYTYGYAGDGLAWDDQGRLYTSEWSTNSCHRYDTSFTHPPETVSSGHDGPADIYINRRDNILCVPNFYRHDVDFVDLNQSSADDITIPQNYYSLSNYPNPFNAGTTIKYSLESEGPVSIQVFDLMGRRIETLVNTMQNAGGHCIIWNADRYSSGTYFYRIKAGEYSETRKMMLVK